MDSHGGTRRPEPRRSQPALASLPAVHRRLAQPRPPLDRVTNQYVETPLRPLAPPPARPPPSKPLRSETGAGKCRDSNFALVSLPVTTGPPVSVQQQGIVCGDCGRCRCASCRTPRPLPAGFLCGTSCLCSPASVLDCVTCMCVPKAWSYHCASEQEDHSKPGWVCLALSTLLCPCLLCYLPCKGLIRLCEACHRLYTTPGCRCAKVYASSSPAPPTPPTPLEKRLLDSP